MRSVLLCLVLVSGFFGAGTAWGQKELHVAAAADLQPVMPVLAAAYEHATGIKLIVSYGSSATLTTQILNGAPMDLFLAADFVFPEKVVAAGLSDMKEPTAYAKGTLVLWARKDSPLQPLSMEKLTDPRVTRIAIANAEHAPYGRAAVAALHKLNLYDKVSPHLVVAENIAQTAQFVESGNAQLGLISLTTADTAHFKEIGTYVLVPTVYPELRQCAVVIAKSKHRADAHAFLDWLLTPTVQTNLSKLGLAAVR
ncbi:molybdate ABC transporter substrate-binding protein [Edaphobacter paludis]|uniref:Molybdate ABC transporter substrate-binding protein n=1 Tax=Edaphobacter paludis TaxID=3035702 RepID=A0AAU7D312_9BACT